ncbi:MAG: hypothetical protein M1834_007001 [Cirrosporium novae-zelandiae]|nr:MAG: hypothetical protein M1834_007001 [Cirrosporium novae-zelandiae]
MSRVVIYNATILTLDDKDVFYYPGTIEIEDDRITKIYEGRPSDEVLKRVDSTIDGTDKLVMPGLVDLHFHTSVAKGYGDNLPLWEFLDQVWYPSIRALNPKTACIAALYSYCTALKSGTTTVNDMYRFLDGLADAAAATGIRAVLSNDVALPEHELDSVEDNILAYQRNNGRESGRIKVWMGHEWICLSNPELLAEIGRKKKELGTGLHIHLSESTTEVQDTLKRYGKSPVQLAYEAGCLGPDVVAAHCVHLSDEDIALFAKTGTSVSYNGGSNAKLGNGVMPLQALQAAGVNVGMGVDACECHNSTDMFELMKIGSFMQRAKHQDPSLTQASTILRMATRNGAKALGIDAGVLQVGKKADVIVVDLTKDMMFSPLLKDPKARKEMLESHLVFGCNGTAVEHVIIDGRIVVRDFKIVGVDEEAVRKDMDTLFESIVADMKRLTMDSQNKN